MYRNTYTNLVMCFFKIMPLYQTNVFTLLQYKEKNIEKFNPKLNES